MSEAIDGTAAGPSGPTETADPAGDPEPGDESAASGAPAPTEASGAGHGSGAAGIDRSPGRTSAAVAVALSGVAALWLPTDGGHALGAVGTALVGVGAFSGRRRTVTAGAVTLLTAVAVAGLGGASTAPLVGSTVLALLAWDAGRYGITVGEQLGRAAATTRLELAHVAVNAAVGTAAAALAVAAYALVDGGRSGVAVVVLLVGVGLVLSALR